MTLAAWVHHCQQDVIEYSQEEIRAVRDALETAAVSSTTVVGEAEV
jgi:hypothetical protein